MKKTAIIVAGGSGVRMGQELPKQFITLHGKPILLHALDAFLHAYDDIHIVLVLPKDYISLVASMIENHGYNANIMLVEGGDTRFHSVRNGMKYVVEESLVFVHDAVRCLVTPELIKRCGIDAQKHGTAIPVVPVRDSIRKKTADGIGSQVIPRDNLFIVQTPQTFLSQHILPAFDLPYSNTFTDEATVVETFGIPVHLVDGDEKNIKITFPEDLAFAEWRLGVINR
jgi:2-C-methyl-D-erythritol 4-phosphate cytidylyltransferase